MAAIDIGPGASLRSTFTGANRTTIELDNPANDTGTITEMKVYLRVSASAAKVGTMYASPSPDYTPRDFEVIGAILQDAIRTLSGLDIDVTTGDYATFYSNDGRISNDILGGSDRYILTGDGFGGENTYALQTPWESSIEGSGATAAVEGGGAITLQSGGGATKNYATGGAGIVLIGF